MTYANYHIPYDISHHSMSHAYHTLSYIAILYHFCHTTASHTLSHLSHRSMKWHTVPYLYLCTTHYTTLYTRFSYYSDQIVFQIISRHWKGQRVKFIVSRITGMCTCSLKSVAEGRSPTVTRVRKGHQHIIIIHIALILVCL